MANILQDQSPRRSSILNSFASWISLAKISSHLTLAITYTGHRSSAHPTTQCAAHETTRMSLNPADQQKPGCPYRVVFQQCYMDSPMLQGTAQRHSGCALHSERRCHIVRLHDS